MAIYTPPSLPHTPHTLPPLPAELIASCSMWPYTKHELLTPPLTSTFEQRKTSNGNAPVHLPPIASFDRRPPLTPPDDISFKYASPYLPPIVPIYPSSHEDVPMLDYSAHDAPPQDLDIDWLNHDRTLNARLIAEKACEMVCWLWFGSDTSPRPEDAYPSPIDAPFTRPTSAQVLQLNPSPIFVQFMQKLLETTQVSHSVIVLSLYYIRRLRTKARASVQEGSEFRIAVAGLMMANKFLDDNTYTNKTWADVSGIGMEEINRMEREFLDGVDYNLYVDQPAFESWVQLLRGLVAAKQTAVRQYRKGRGRSGRPAPASAPRDHSSRRERWHRTRSTSPRSSEVAMSRSSEVAMSRSCAGPAWTPPSLPIIHAPSPIICTPSPGSKRTASAAFSPTTATFSDVPAKRADVPAQRASISVQIPEYPQTYNAGAAPASYNAELQTPSKPELDSPLDPSSCFARLSVHSRPSTPPGLPRMHPPQRQSSAQHQSTLSSAYTLDEARRAVVPQVSFLFGTRLEECTREEHTWRKARLRCQHPPPASTFAQHYVQTLPSLPMMVQSARTSPYEAVSALPRDAVSSLPRDAVSSLPRDALSSMPRDAVSSLPRDAATSLPPSAAPAYPSPHAEALKVYTPSLEVDMPSLKVDMPSLKVYSPSPQRHAPVQFAPFANAGPPGVHQFYPSPAGQRYPQAPVSPNAYYASPNAYDASSNAYDASSNAYGASSNAYGASSNAYGASPNAYYPPRRRVY
ncbi:cyclin-domain-containing protein [Schizophyllum amplum]|uniref:Cyclin-domain-containing protein n=1 Tax=Schizophyllum amplum TaxID=97359 RepID=A0A550CDA3_9AGAR|nr:cyclin-domain-containing protein [Auriculariopsis ampla]